MLLLVTALLSLLITVSAAGQSAIDANAFRQKPDQGRPVAPTDEQASRMLRSPYLIEWFIDVNDQVDLKQIWRLLKIDFPSDAPSRCSDCSAETFELDAKGEQSKAVALRISFESGGFYQYLIFNKVKGDSTEEWMFIGHVDSSGQKSGPPAHRIESGDNRTWFVIRESWGRESGMKVYGDVWHEITAKEVRRVLSYPVYGQITLCENQPGRSYKSILLRHELENRVYTVPIQLLISYNIPDCAKGEDAAALFAKAQKAYFVWDNEKARFTLDESRSDVTEKEMSEVYNAGRLSGEKFIEYNFKELSEIAKAGDARQKNWLRSFLPGVKDTQQKLALKRALAQ